MKNKQLTIAYVLFAICGFVPYAPGQTLTIDSFMSVEETAGEIAIEVRLSGALDSIVTVDYATEDLDAEAGRDFHPMKTQRDNATHRTGVTFATSICCCAEPSRPRSSRFEALMKRPVL